MRSLCLSKSSAAQRKSLSWLTPIQAWRRSTLDILAKRGRGVKVELITHSNGELEESDFEAFGKQCGKFTKSICGICHDRFIIIDNTEIYAIGASLKDAGRLTFGISKMGDSVIPGLLANLRNATSAQKEYAK